jgi:hypothetical protein
MSEFESEPEGTFQDSMPSLQSHVDPSGKTTSISCECGGCAMAVVDTVVTALVAVGVVVLPHALKTSATALSAMAAGTGVKRRACTLATLGPSNARRAGIARSLSSLGDLGYLVVARDRPLASGEQRLGEVVTLFGGGRHDEDGRADVTDVLVEKVVRAKPILEPDEIPRVVLIGDEQ